MRTFVREKKIYCGDDYLEVDVFNYTKNEEENAQSGKRSKKETESTQKQVDWNDRNSRRRFMQSVHTNFGEGDYHVSLTYSPANLPQTAEEAENDRTKFKRKVEYWRKKAGLPPGKYICITNCKYKKDGVTPARIHHHIIMSGGLPRETVEGLWRKRKRKGQKKADKIGFANADSLQPDENGLSALCDYLARQAGGKKRYSSSQNLDKPDPPEVRDQNDPVPEPPPEPIPELPQTGVSRVAGSANLQRPWSRTNNHSFSRKEVQRIANTPIDREYWERRYPGYTLMGEKYGFEKVHSESRGWALYLKLRRIKD